MESLWHPLLLNQFHDVLPGSSVREVYERAEAELGEVVTRAQGVAREKLRALAELLVPEGDRALREGLLVVNADLSAKPLRVELSEKVAGAQAVANGFVISSPQEVAGLSANVVLNVPVPTDLSVSEQHLENAFVRAEFADDGTLARLYDKRHGREVLTGRGNQLWAYVDKPRAWDAWDIDAGYEDQGEEVTQLGGPQVTEGGPHRATVRFTRRFRNSTIIQDVRLWANSARLEFKTTLDWHDRRWLLKARFPLHVRAEHALFETAFGTVGRPTHRNTSWDAARFEVPGHRFADLSEPGYGVALLNDGRYGYHAHGSELGLSLLRAPVWPDALADEGAHAFTYTLLPHTGDWLSGGVLAEAEDLNRPVFATPVKAPEARTWRPLSLSGLPLGLGCLKPEEDGSGLILRAYEPRGARGTVALTLPEGWSQEAVSLLEDPLANPTGDRHGTEATFSPFQIQSWRLRQG